jgi:hypothetical protein
MLANDCSAGEGPFIYSYSVGRLVCINEIIIVNCEGFNANYRPMINGSTFQHWFNAVLREIKIFAW